MAIWIMAIMRNLKFHTQKAQIKTCNKYNNKGARIERSRVRENWANANARMCFRGSSHALRPRLHTWRICTTIVDPTGSPIQGHTCPLHLWCRNTTRSSLAPLRPMPLQLHSKKKMSDHTWSLYKAHLHNPRNNDIDVELGIVVCKN